MGADWIINLILLTADLFGLAYDAAAARPATTPDVPPAVTRPAPLGLMLPELCAIFACPDA